MFAFTIDVTLVPTRIVANDKDEAGNVGATGEAAAVPVTTCKIQSLDEPAYAASRTVKHTKSIRVLEDGAVEIVNVTAASLYNE
jgi:hypothetical protein